MRIEILPEDYLINPVSDGPGTLQSDFVLKAIRFVNETEKTAELTEIIFLVYADEKIVKEIRYAGEALATKLTDGSHFITHRSPRGLKSSLGSSILWNLKRSVASAVLQPGEETAVVNEFFIVINKSPVDRLDIRVRYRENDTEEYRDFSVPVVNYHTKNSYIFPVKGGGWQVSGNYDSINGHRTGYSMEFAMDLVKLDHESRYVWSGGMKDEAALSYGEDVTAIGDGVVVDCFRDAYWRVNFPHDPADDAKQAEWDNIEQRYGGLPFQCGNYVVIKHDHEEYSFYCHMIRDSLTVSVGDTVKQGIVIGKIGNVGLSGAPNLHFQLMAGPDFYGSRGLPCHFTNIEDEGADSLELVQEEYTIIYAS